MRPQRARIAVPQSPGIAERLKKEPILSCSASEIRPRPVISGLRPVAWPLLLATSAGILAFGFSRGQPTLFFNLSYAWLVMSLLLCERLLPYRTDWRRPDGQLRQDLSHTVLNKGLVQLFIVAALGTGLVAPPSSTALSLWPLWLQVAFGLVASELGLYWAHRLAHEWPLLWRCHSVHHSVKKLWLVNTGRFHFIDSLASVLASLPFLLGSGISMDAVVWVSAITAYIGILTHCNVDMRCGPLSLLFNTPELHRWHHAVDPAIGNRNYGENLMIWDHVFGTYFHRPGEHVETIGISEYMPAEFLGQLWLPFRWKKIQAEAAAESQA